jgi:hypothetical protein
MSTQKNTSYDISISADGIWAGSGIYEDGNIRDCAAILGGSQDDAETIYEMIEDAITEMDAPADGEIEADGVTYSWTLTERE